MIASDSLPTYLVIAIFLFVIGIYGLIRQRSVLGMLISMMLILNGAALNFMAFNRFLAPDTALGQMITFVIMGIAAAEVLIFVSFMLGFYKRYSTNDPDAVKDLKH